MDIEIEDYSKGEWRLMAFYGHPERCKRRDSWNLLRRLHSQSSLPWCCIGDFNDLLGNHEKKEKNDHPIWCIRGFREVVSDCGLHDLPLEGYPFTWEKSKGTTDAVEEKLDHALVSASWMNIFMHPVLSNLVVAISDHSPILLNTEVQVSHAFLALLNLRINGFVNLTCRM